MSDTDPLSDADIAEGLRLCAKSKELAGTNSAFLYGCAIRDVEHFARLHLADALREVARLRERISAAMYYMYNKIDQCCGEKAGKEFCEMYGCATLLEILTKLNPAPVAAAPVEATAGETKGEGR